ncbi:hypothetical protein NC652_005504 [Populus alba x Populus x berolinensis]|uniref:Uncharacterized protein n=1 Tax=Populus alba x Populus x berolinensis TaxID=444605 RepID=A0AAD6WB25_9ROSI|nr:hypothetical protein NC651_004729 [Populus alba x Populus x berolinensis]KAJ6953790.1 hypothetical protein NC652_005504 [Populus alba x Populus x berolinensis]KAJ7006158.1 hypothetical protein NC653_005499 [Populus alba x Populus x berolinensis]
MVFRKGPVIMILFEYSSSPFEDSTAIRHKTSPLAHLLVTGQEINAMHLGPLEPRGQRK